MITAKEDKLRNFVKVTHRGTGKEYRLHNDDLDKLQSPKTVAVYDFEGVSYHPPDTDCPKGKYLATVKYFVGSYLDLIQPTI
jgi:hypothetical protein